MENPGCYNFIAFQNSAVMKFLYDQSIVAEAKQRLANTSIASAPSAPASKTPNEKTGVVIGFAGINEIMQHFAIPPRKRDALDGRLKRFRRQHAADGKAVIEHDAPARNQPRYLYNLAMVEPLVKDLAAPDTVTDKRPTEDFPAEK
jgi:hypothetical protein